ncbi:hypothetical protein L228DRAFT_171180 [Xylona heveae TC161]|uniref:Uncharacterized protein n=1 Tax=Xylona heveae (strain CBS 132557 / TC161) TaxID=1328760 RepID=A0A165FTN4_XYLHT|nr:hypothetical protein L228DRAFT_171180 [Xylona heveae TC161]KZF21363.1 hypothetical protein L228DRAFT_171180 [Xylona heveae TC161]
MLNLLIALLVLVFLGLMLVAALLVLRNHRRSRKQAELPLYNEKPGRKNSNHRRLTITAAPYGNRSEPVFVYDEKRNLVENSSSPPESPIPEIRITFPEEEDEGGKRKSGRVLVVHVGDKSVGMEPLEEDLPPYHKGDDGRFQSLDLERIGGLKEKEFEQRFS